MLIGTHAVLSSNVVFKDLEFAIIDEQQRFGVIQRSALLEKGRQIDYIMMSATPIPRSLEMAFFGELKISTVRTMPPGRKPVITYTVKEGNEEKIYTWVRKELAMGHQAYFVYPLIDESEKMNLKNASQMHETLSKEVFPDYKCALIHWFSLGEADILRRNMSKKKEDKLRAQKAKFMEGAKSRGGNLQMHCH